MAENFDLIFGQNASQQYAWNDTDYQNGWETIGNIPPTAAQFDALQRRSDTKMKELNDELTPLVNADTADSRQPSTTYSVDDIKYSPLLPTGWFLACTVSGMSSASELVVPSPVEEGDEITDGGVTWKIKKIGGAGDAGDGVPLGAIIPLAHNSTIPAGYLLCDGSAVSRTMFPDLFSAIGTTYGAGDGSTTFNLPNYSDGKFPEGSTVAGVVKQPGLPNIEGSQTSLTLDGGEAPRTSSFYGAGDGALFGNGSASYSQKDLASSVITGCYPTLNIDASRSSAIYGASDTVQPYSLTTRYIIKAYDGVTPTPSQADISEMLTELTGKADRRLSNLDTANLACHVVVDSHYDNTTGNWWRKYDDGWVEQGGLATGLTGNTHPTIQVTLLKPMADSLYECLYCRKGTSAGTATLTSVIVIAQTSTTVTFSEGLNGASAALQNDFYWRVEGQGAQS